MHTRPLTAVERIQVYDRSDAMSMIESAASSASGRTGMDEDEIFKHISFDPISFMTSPSYNGMGHMEAAGKISGIIEKSYNKPGKRGGMVSKILKVGCAASFALAAAFAGSHVGQAYAEEVAVDYESMKGKLSEIVNRSQGTSDPLNMTLDAYGKVIFEDVTSLSIEDIGNPFGSFGNDAPTSDEPARNVGKMNWLNFYNATDTSKRPGLDRESLEYAKYMDEFNLKLQSEFKKIAGVGSVQNPNWDVKMKQNTDQTYSNRSERIGNGEAVESERAMKFLVETYGNKTNPSFKKDG